MPKVFPKARWFDHLVAGPTSAAAGACPSESAAAEGARHGMVANV